MCVCVLGGGGGGGGRGEQLSFFFDSHLKRDLSLNENLPSVPGPLSV